VNREPGTVNRKPDLLLIHTVPLLVELFQTLCRERLPGKRELHVVDEPLLEGVRQRGGLALEDADRLLEHVRAAESIGARAILVTCSTISPAVDRIRNRTSLPVLKIDDAMVQKAVAMDARLGVCVTNPTTVEPTRLALSNEAARQGKSVKVELHLVKGAWDALAAGEAGAHDRLVTEAVVRIQPKVDVVILAQASMLRSMPAILAAGCRIPVLSTPALAIEEVAKVLGSSEF